MPEFTEEARSMIWTAVHETPAVDVRTFVRHPRPSDPGESGLDGLLTSPGVLEEFFRRRAQGGGAGAEPEVAAAREAYIKSLTPGELADIVWRQLFVDHPPLSEATRVVLTAMGLFGLDVASGDLRILREQYDRIPPAERLEKIMRLANLRLVLYPVESLEVEEENGLPIRPPSFRPVLSLNLLLGDWKESARKLRTQGFGVKGKVDEFAPLELRRHLGSEIARLGPAALSLDWPAGHHALDDGVGRLVREAALPLCRERGLPFFIAAGEAEDIGALSPLWENEPEIRFLLFPSREDQLFPASRAATRHRNLLLCGPDGPLAYPHCLELFIGRRLETCGSTFHACHSGAVIPEELVGRWAHMRWVLGETLIRRYAELWRTGWRYTEAGVRQDVTAILGGNARKFMGI